MSVSLLSLQTGSARPEAAGAMAGSTTVEDAQAWQREMERCQMRDWLRHGPVNQVRQAPALDERTMAAVDETLTTPQAISSLSTRLALNMPATPASAWPGWDAGTIRAWPGAMPTIDHGDGNLGAVMEQRVTAPPRQTADDTIASVRKGGQGNDGKTMPLPRITLERVGAGIRVWLGVDLRADISSQVLQHLVQAISAVLDGAGVRLDGVMLNGRPMALSQATQQDALVFHFYFDLPRER